MNAGVRLGTVMAILVCAIATVTGIERMPLPSFSVTTADGRTVTTDQLIRPGKWLLIYLQPNCPSCEAILRMIKKDEHPLVPPQLVVVVGAATAEAVRAGSVQFPDLAEARWFADPTRSAIGPLRIVGAPVIFGVNRGTIEWSLYGVLSDSADVKSVLASWVEMQ